MKASKFLGNEKLQLIDIPKPKAKNNTVVIKVRASGICATDLELLYRSDQEPLSIPGHEVAGDVVEIDKTKKVKIGERVIVNCHITCRKCDNCSIGDLIFCKDLKVVGFDVNGGNAEYILVPDSCCQQLPDDISYEKGVLLSDVLGTSYHAIKRSELKIGELIGIFGLGPMGLCAVLASLSKGGKVVAIDFNNYRLNFAKRLGATHLIDLKTQNLEDEVLKLTKGKGFDKVIECSGKEKAINQALNLIKNRGRIVLVGVCREAKIKPNDQIINKETEIFGSRNFNAFEYNELIEFIRANPILEGIVTHRFNLEEAQVAIDTMVNGKCGKVIFSP